MKYLIHSIMYGKSKGKREKFIAFFLYLASLFYGAGIYLVNKLFDSNVRAPLRLPCKVISIGNITVGGTGKTPFVKYCADLLSKKGKKVLIAARGYGGADEALMMKEKSGAYRMAIGKNRYKEIQKAMQEEKVDICILDDGFQHRKIHRDLDIVIIDATNPFGEKHLIPRGIMRESLEGLARSDMVLISKVDDIEADVGCVKTLIRNSYRGEIGEYVFEPSKLRKMNDGEFCDLNTLKGERTMLCSAIGNPDYFRYCSAKTGASIVGEEVFLDHHKYTKKDALLLVKHASMVRAKSILVTEKDYVKLDLFKDIFENSDIGVYSLIIEVVITKNKESTHARLDRILSLQNI